MPEVAQKCLIFSPQPHRARASRVKEFEGVANSVYMFGDVNAFNEPSRVLQPLSGPTFRHIRLTFRHIRLTFRGRGGLIMRFAAREYAAVAYTQLRP